ncbi:MAG: outer membrane protein assembly factor BamB [Planctomycetota bacterium]|jgi:outer membrane protein assembly factor BamB
MLLAICLVLAPTLSTAATPQDSQGGSHEWTRFRGPNGSGVAEVTGLPDHFNLGDNEHNNVLWRSAIANGYSSPVLFGGRLFLTGSAEGHLFTFCLDADTGLVLWQREAPRHHTEKLDGRNNPASPSPVVDGDVVVVFFPESGLLAYDHFGEELWKMQLGPYNNVYGMGASPILVGDAVYLACDQALGSYLLCVDKKNGEKLWRTERPEAKSGHCTPILRTNHGGEMELILPGSFLLDAYNLETGLKHWSSDGLCFEMKSVPILHGDLVIVAGYGSPMNQPGSQVNIDSFADVLSAGDTDSNGKLSKEEMPPSRASAWFDFVDLDQDGFLDARDWSYLESALASQNGLLAFQAPGAERTSALPKGELKWSYRRAVPQLPSPVIYGDILYLLADSGGLLSTFNPSTGEELGKERIADAGDTYYASPVAGDGKVYLFSEHGIVSVLPAGGSLEAISVVDLEEKIYATPALATGRIYLRTVDAMYCFKGEE